MEERAARDLWASFQHDPRDPSIGSLRASDADRNIVHAVLTEAFADGRLDREEYDERTAATLQARTLADLPPLMADLVPDRPLVSPVSSRAPLVSASPSDIQQRAEAKWREDRRSALMGFVGSAVLLWAIWLATAWGDWYFPWPLIVNALALMNFLRVATNRQDIVAGEVRRLERKQAKAIEAQRKKNPPTA